MSTSITPTSTITPVSTVVPESIPASISNNLKSINTPSPANNISQSPIKKTFTKIKETVSIKDKSNVSILMTVIIIFVLCLIAYFISKTYRVGTSYENLKMYENYFLLSNTYLENKDLNEKPLKNFYVASGFRPYMAINQLLDYTSTKLLQKVIMSGVRFIYMDVYNSNLKFNPSPVVSNGFEKGNWKLTLNTTPFDDMCKVIAQTAFNAGFCENYNDPFFLALNLNVNNNILCLNKIRNIIYDHFKYTLLPPEFSNLQANLAETPIKKLMSKLIIITSDGYQNSQLTELINGSWNDPSKINLINFDALDPTSSGDNSIKLKPDTVIEYNKKGLTIVTPNLYNFFTINNDSKYAFESGCQFICMNYQKKSNISDYISVFKNSSFVLKPSNLI